MQARFTKAMFAVAVLFVVLPAAVAQGLKPVFPEPKPLPVAPVDPVPLDVGRYLSYSVDGYTGPVTWQIEGTAAGFKEVNKPLTLFGTAQGTTEPGEYDVPAGGVILWGKTPGPVKLVAWGVVDGKAKHLFSKSFVVGGQAPQPPPGPKPGPVVPATELGKKLQAAYSKGPDPAALANLIAAMTDATTICNDPSLGDAGALERAVRANTIAKTGKAKLPAVGQVIGEYLSGKVPTDPTAPLTAEVRATAATAYAELANTLKEIR